MAEENRPAAPATVTFDDLAAAYLEDYELQRYRTLDSARGRVANLKAVFGQPAHTITPAAIRQYQLTRRQRRMSAATKGPHAPAGELPGHPRLRVLLRLAATGDHGVDVGRGGRRWRRHSTVAHPIQNEGRSIATDLEVAQRGAGPPRHATAQG